MIALMVLILIGGLIVFWIGYSTSQAAGVQTAADAAALAAENSAVVQLRTPRTGPNGEILPPAIDWGEACAQADHYAALNHAHRVACIDIPTGASTIGYDVKVEVQSNDSLPSGSPASGQSATAWARASTDPFAQASPAINTSVTSSCDASAVPGPTFSAHGGDFGFFPDAKADYSFGCEPRLAGELDALGQALKLTLRGSAGYVPQSQAKSNDPAAVAHGCGDASTTARLNGVSDATLSQFKLVRPFPGHRNIVELAGVSCEQQTKSVDAGAAGPVGLGNLNVHLVPVGGGPQGALLSLVGGGASAIGESPLQVGCQIYKVWQSLNVPQELLLIALMVAQDESAMGQNIGPNRTDPNQSIGVFQQISADGWGTIPEELNVTTAAEMFFLGAHGGGVASTTGLLTNWQAHPGEATWELAQDTQISGAGQSTHGLANYGAPANIQAAQSMLGQVTGGGCGNG